MKNEYIVELRKITKRFGGVTALNNVDLELRAGEILALVGDNGAGKSTLIKILSGVYTADSGEIFFKGERVTVNTSQDSWKLGISTIFQELALADKMNVIDNIFIGHELKKRVMGIPILDKAQMYSRTNQLLERVGMQIGSLSEKVMTLSGGQRQAVAISRALNLGAKIVIMDEPTAALGVAETKKVLDFIKQLKEQGTSVIIISHNLPQVFSVADEIIVLRHGRRIGKRKVEETNENEIVKLITGVL